MNREAIVNKIKSKWQSVQHPKRVFGGVTYRFEAWATTKDKAKAFAREFRGKGYKVRVVYAPIRRARKLTWDDFPQPLARWEGRHKEFPAWDIYISK